MPQEADRAAPAAGEHVVDVGTASGTAALLAAARGARVTGVDRRRACSTSPARKLRPAALMRRFALGEATALPLADGEADR